jgi:hypothetical protein
MINVGVKWALATSLSKFKRWGHANGLNLREQTYLSRSTETISSKLRLKTEEKNTPSMVRGYCTSGHTNWTIFVLSLDTLVLVILECNVIFKLNNYVSSMRMEFDKQY